MFNKTYKHLNLNLFIVEMLNALCERKYSI